MSNIRSMVSEAIQSEKLPDEAVNFLKVFLDDTGKKFVEEECSLWDYKQVFPHSRSDEYCAGIVKTICAFHNTHGGLLFFGVHDGSRSFGHNLVKINIESFNAFIGKCVSSPIECKVKTITIPNAGNKRKVNHVNNFTHKENIERQQTVDVLLIPQRQLKQAPVTIAKEIHPKYPLGSLYLRKLHESHLAKSEDLPFMFSRRIDPYNERAEIRIEGTKIPSDLPNNPSTLKTFVGRVKVLTELWEWLFSSRDSRRFLWGDGGSGKTTVAFEFANLVIENTWGLKTYYGYAIDQVIFLSAKQRELDPVSREIVQGGRSDFDNAKELFTQILVMSELHNYEDLKGHEEDYLIDELEILFDNTNILLIIDDIDTLTTSKKDSGLETLADMLSRSDSGSKALYTLRTLPTLAIRNSINVPGLDRKTEYKKFVETCCHQFEQPMPKEEILYGKMEEVSDRRPLVLEVIIGLKRTASNYEDAISAYEGIDGDSPRTYMFEREYNALTGKLPKLILAALNEFNKPVSFDEISIILRSDEDQIRSSLLEVSAIFISQTTDTDDTNTLFSLNKVSKRFIAEISCNLDFYEKIKEKVKNLTKGQRDKSIEVEKLILMVDRCFRRNEHDLAYTLLFSKSYPPATQERSDFRALRGFVAAKQKTPELTLTNMREEMTHATDLGTVNLEYIREWYYVEMKFGEIKGHVLEVCDRVINGKGYRPAAKAEFMSRKGYALAKLSRDVFHGSNEECINFGKESVESNLLAYVMASKSKTFSPEKIIDGIEKSIFSLFNLSNSANEEKLFYDAIYNLMSDSKIVWDTFPATLNGLRGRFMKELATYKDIRIGNLTRIRGLVKNKKTSFHFESNRTLALKEIDSIINQLNLFNSS